MSAPAFRGRRLVATALARAESFLLEPVEAVPSSPAPAAIRLRAVVAVVGLRPRCGATTVARALAAALAVRDPAGAAAVSGEARAGVLAPAGTHATRLARALGSGAGERTRAAGRLCLVEGGAPRELADAVRHLAPLVIDVGEGGPAGVAASLADHVLLVASPAVEPALALVVATSLSRIGPSPRVVLNPVGAGERDLERWEGRAHAALARSRAGALLALAGREAGGALGPALAELAESCAEAGAGW